MRAIDGDTLIKKAYDEAKGMAEPYDDFGTLVEWLVDKVPTIEPEQQWIPCSERLPDIDGIYLVYAPNYKGGSSTAKENYNGVMFSKCQKGKWSIEHGYYKRPNCVIAWMPLPEPYREEGEKR